MQIYIKKTNLKSWIIQRNCRNFQSCSDSPSGTKTAKVQDQFECLYYLGCITLNAGSKWPPYANADSSKGYWELKAENGSSAKKVKKSPTTEEIEAAIAQLKNNKNEGTQQKPLE